MMNPLPFVNSFRTQWPAGSETVTMQFYLFCGNPLFNKRQQYSYSIICRLHGIRQVEAIADIVSYYGRHCTLKDRLYLENAEFIFSNVSLVAASFYIRIKATGILQTGAILSIDTEIELKYSLRQIFISGIKTHHHTYDSRVISTEDLATTKMVPPGKILPARTGR